MNVVAYQRTMAGAKRIIEEKRKKPTPKRDALIALVERWKEEESARKEQKVRDTITRLRAVNVPQTLTIRIVPYTPAADIIAQVAFWHGVGAHEITGPSRSWLVVAARFDAAAALAVNCRIVGRELTLAEIGRYLGGRDHSTIWMALRQRGLR